PIVAPVSGLDTRAGFFYAVYAVDIQCIQA
ncbi:unnamed protein product, partial [marine sediment metagenome]